MRRLDARPTRPRSPRARAFTLVELLVVIAIIGVLVALLLPAIQAARESARRTQCSNNLHQIGIGMINFHDSKKHFPAGEWKPAGVPTSGGLAWSAWFLPYIEQQNVHNLMDFKADMRKPPNWQPDLTGLTNTVIPTYLCPSAASHQTRRDIDAGRLTDFNNNGAFDVGTGEGLAAIDYIGISGPAQSTINHVTNMAYDDNRGVLLNLDSGPPCFGTPSDCFAKTISIRNITDGTSHTMIVGECSGRGVADSNGDLAGGESFNELDGAWASKSNVGKIKLDPAIHNLSAINPPPAVNWREEELFSDHPGGAHVLMCDGSVHFLSEDTEARVYFALASRDGEEVVEGGY
jgi:prepilin-type N-terminal cleavage/methylation domain-containing protein/prepilin-type processing-associated H-X9-DG protein